jgi:hypothetical protein
MSCRLARALSILVSNAAAGYTQHMRTLLLVMAASLAGACVVEEPVGEPGAASWSAAEADLESQAEPDAVWRPSCEHHFQCCHDTTLGDRKDDHGRTRCYFCAERCDQEGE